MSSAASNAAPRQAALSDDMDYEDKHMYPPPQRSHHLESPIFSRRSVHSVSSSVENSPAAPASAKAYTNSPLKTRHSESELLVSPRNLDEYPRYEPKKKMSADFSDDTMSVGSIGNAESPKSDKGSWRIRSAVAGPFLTGPLAKDFQTELKTPRGKAREDMNFDHSGLMFPLAPVLDAIPDTPRGGYNHQPQGFTDISQFENSSQPMDGFNLDHSGYASSEQVAFNNNSRRMPVQQPQEAMLNSQYYAGYAGQGGVVQGGFDPSMQQSVTDSHQYNSVSQSAAIVATQSSNAHAPSYADVVARANGNSGSSNSNEQSLVASFGSDSLESLSKGMADSMAQILAKTKNGRSFGEVQLTTLVQKIHLHMNIMGRTSAAIREDYNRIKTKLEQTITDKKVLEATNYHLQQLVQQYEVERQYFHQYVLHSLQSQSSLIYESMGNLSQNVAQSKYTIEELSARLSRELSNIQGSRGNDSQLKEVLEEIKRAVGTSTINAAQQGETRPHSPSRSTQSTAGNPSNDNKSEESKASGFKLTPVLLAVLLWIATLGGVYFSAKSAALTELQQSASASSILPSDLDSIVDQISQKLESAVQASEVRKLVYTELKQNPEIVESVVGSAADGFAEEISQRLDKEVKTEQREPEVVISREPSTSESADEKKVVEVTEANVVSKEKPQTEDVETAVIAEPKTSVKSVAPVDIDIVAPSDVIPPAVVESESSFVEIEVPPVEDHKQTHDAVIEKLLHLDGLPGSDSSSDVVLAAGAEDVASQSPLDAGDATGSDVAADKPAEAEDEISAKKAENSNESSVKSQALDESSSPEVDAEVAAPDVEAEEIIEIAIESAVNPVVIIQKEEQLRDNTTAAVEPESITFPIELSVVSDSDAPVSVNETAASEAVTSDATDVIADDVTSVVIEEADVVKTAFEVTVDPVVSSPDDVKDVKGKASLSNAEATTANELEGAETKSAVDRDENIKTQASNEEVDEVVALESKASAASAEVKEATSPATTSDEPKVSVDNISSSGDALVQGDVDSVEGVGVSAATEQPDASTSFAGLSMALRSLASHLVDGFDIKQDEPIHAVANVVTSSGKPKIASETVEEDEPVASEPVKVTDEVTVTVDAVEGVDAVIEVPVIAKPASTIETESEDTELSNQDEPVSETEGSIEAGEIAADVNVESPIAEVDAGVESLATDDEVAAGLSEEARDAGKFKETVELVKSVEEAQVAALDSVEEPDPVSVESGEASSTLAETTLEGAESALPEFEIAVSSIVDLPSTEAGEEAAKPSKDADQPSQHIDVITEVSDATLVVPEAVEDVSSTVKDAFASNVNAVEPVDSADSTADSTVPVDDMSEKLGTEIVEVDTDEVMAEAKEPIEADAETESLGKTKLVITEVIDVDGNIDSPSAKLMLSTPVEAESEAAADAVSETTETEAEADTITIIIDDSEVASLLAKESASEDEREAPVEEAAESAKLDAEPLSSVASALTNDSLPEPNAPVDTDSPGKFDEELGDISSRVGDIGSLVAGDAIGSVEPLNPRQSSSSSNSGSNDVGAADVIDSAVAAAVPKAPSEQLDVSPDESQPEMNIAFVDPFKDVEVSKIAEDDVIASEADKKVVEPIEQAEGDVADVDEPSKTADSTHNLPVTSASTGTLAESDDVDISGLLTGAV